MKMRIFWCVALAAAVAAQAKELAVLSVGNSFSRNAHRYLREIVAASEGDTLTLENCYIGGCSMERHLRHAKAEEKVYDGKTQSLRDKLVKRRWDIVTIQQASHESFRTESYRFADELIAYIRRYAPDAEIVIFQTWAYRNDHNRLRKPGFPTSDESMYEQLAAAYGLLQRRLGLRLIPGGDAFQNAKHSPLWGAAETPPKTSLHAPDGFHASPAGEYLLGLVWYETLFAKPATQIPWRPDTVDPQEAKLLRQIAHTTVAARYAPLDLLPELFIEAETFDNPGGWSIDQQFIPTIGSPILLAHGLGKPVPDATTTITIPKDATYRVYARTRNWAAPWTQAAAPGRFRIAIDHIPLSEELGTQRTDWHWQYAGTIPLKQGKSTLALQDLTGFDGRCDAIILTTSEPPTNLTGPLERVRRATRALAPASDEEIKSDLIVVGGGIAGICTAISAARLGLTVSFLHDRPVLGGNNSSEVRVWLGGRINIGRYPRLGDIVAEIGPAGGGNASPAKNFEDSRKLNAVLAEKNIRLYLACAATGVTLAPDGAIETVTGLDIRTGKERRFRAPLVVDCTGDGAVGAFAGAAYFYGREAQAQTGEARAQTKPDRRTMGASVQWNTRKEPSRFPVQKWMLDFNPTNCVPVTMGEWTWETGMDRDQVLDFEAVRDYGLLVVYSNWACLQNKLPADVAEKFRARTLDWVAYVAGKRESRRLEGDVILDANAILSSRAEVDGTCETTWSLDLHEPDPRNAELFPGGAFKSVAIHTQIHWHPVPYRCLYSRTVPNLFMAGRNISTTHVALGTTRLMRTGGMMGEVVGMAAKVCTAHGIRPRQLFPDYFDELRGLMERGVGKGLAQPPQKYNEGGTLGPAKR